MAAPRGCLRPSGAQESPLFAGGVLTKIFSKIQNVTTTFTTTLACYIIRITNHVDVVGDLNGNQLELPDMKELEEYNMSIEIVLITDVVRRTAVVTLFLLRKGTVV